MLSLSLLTTLVFSTVLVLPCTLTQTFDVLRNSELFVDKTFLIKKFLAGPTRHMLVTAPRGFGKTTNLDMIRRFAEMDVLANGTMKTDKFLHKNYKTFADIVPSTGKHLTTFLDKMFFEKHFGIYPVIWLDLDSKDVKTYHKLDFMRLFLKGTIRHAFEEHSYLLNSPVISSTDKKLFQKFLYHNFSSETSVRAYSPRAGIGLLKVLLQQHFKRNSIVLMDNCDAPLREVILDPKQYTDESLGKLFELSNILEAIPGYDSSSQSEPSDRTFITGIIAPFHRSNIYRHKHGLFKSHISGSYGFTQNEIKAIIKTKKLTLELDQVEAWYGGFDESTGRWSHKFSKQLYNPESVVKFLTSKTKKFKAYWSGLWSLESFKPALRPECFGRQVMECFTGCEFPMNHGWPLYGQFSLDMSIEDTKKLQDLQNLPLLPFQCTERTRYFFVTYMENLGYLSYRNWVDRVNPPRSTWLTTRNYSFKIPNLEVSSLVKKLLYDAMVTKTPFNGNAQFRVEFFEAILAVDGSEESMQRFADALVTLLVVSELEPHENGVDNALLAHSVRVHLLYQPSETPIKLNVKTGPTVEDRELGKTNLDDDLIFTVERNKDVKVFDIKLELGEKLNITNQTVLDSCTTMLASMIPQNDTENKTAKVAANLNCDKMVCWFSYLYSNTHLEQENCLRIEKDSVLRKAKARWLSF